MKNGCMAESPRKVCALCRRHDSLSELGGDAKLDCSLAVACQKITNLAQFGLGSVNLTGYGFVSTTAVTSFMTDLCTLFHPTWKLHEILFSFIILISIIRNCSKADATEEMSSMKASILECKSPTTRQQLVCAHKSLNMLHQQGHLQVSRSTGYTVSAQSMEWPTE